MNTLIILSAIVGVVVAQQGDHKDCVPRQSAISARDVQDIYQRPIGYDNLDYSPHSTYGPPDPVRPSPRRNYAQDTSDGASAPRPAIAQSPNYNDIRQQFPFAPVYGTAPPRARAAAAAGIYDDYEDIQYVAPQPAPPPPAAAVVAVRRYNINYAQREPYQPSYGYDTYASRHREYRVPVFYAPLPEAYYPVRLQPSIPVIAAAAAATTTTTEEPRTQPAPITVPITQPSQTVYTTGSEEDDRPRYKFRKPFSGIANLFRGSIISARNKIGLIPSAIQGSVNKFT